MLIKLTIRRSDEWMRAQKLETGENYPERIDVEVRPADLTLAARKVLLEYEDNFCDFLGLGYAESGNKHRGWQRCYSTELFLIDSDNPSPEEISEAIIEADRRVDLEIDKMKKKKERDEERERVAAREEMERKAAAREEMERKAAAREEFADEFAELEAELEHCRRDRLLLADYIACFPHDAQIGALKIMSREREDIDSLAERINSASPIELFSDDE